MPELIDLGALPVLGGHFIAPKIAPTRTPFLPNRTMVTDYRHSHTYAAGASTTRDDLVELIDSAGEKIRVASYLIGDDVLCDAVERAAGRIGGGVHVITNLQASQTGMEMPAVRFNNPDEAAARRRFEELSAQGVAIRGYPGCHAKFAVIDDRAAVVHSANLMTRAFDLTSENGVVILDALEIARADDFFTRLWRGAQWEMDTSGQCLVSKREGEPSLARLESTLPRRGLIWTFHDEHLILDAIIDLVASAEHELVLATFNISEMIRRPDLLHDHLRAAIARGVTVKLVLRARSGLEAGEEAAVLQDLGVGLYPCSLNHAKGVVADRVRGALFSANFDSRFGLDRDVELGVRLDGTHALAEAVRYFEHVMAEHDREFVRDPDARTLALGWCLPRVPLPDLTEVTAAAEDWMPLRDLRVGPVVFEQDSDGLRLYAEYREWRLRPDATRGGFRLERGSQQEIDAMSRLVSTSDRGSKTTAGLCTTVIRRNS